MLSVIRLSVANKQLLLSVFTLNCRGAYKGQTLTHLASLSLTKKKVFRARHLEGEVELDDPLGVGVGHDVALLPEEGAVAALDLEKRHSLGIRGRI